MKVADAPHQSPVPRYSTVARPLNGLWRDGTKCCGPCLASMRFTQGQHSDASREAVCGPFSRVVDNKASVGSLTYNGFLVFLDWCLGTLFGKMTTNELASHRKRTG